jgi:hypothetical protein
MIPELFDCWTSKQPASKYLENDLMCMRSSLVMAAVLASSCLIAVPASAATKVFLLAGQSNMAGVGGYSGYNKNSPPWSDPPYDHADAPCPAPYNAPLAAVKFWNFGYGKKPADFVNAPETGDGWVDLQPGFGHRADQFGPELGFGRRLHELYPNDEIYLIKYAIGGTNLAADWNPNPDAMGPRYKVFKARVDAAMANLTKAGKNPTIVGMIWMQGEDDSTNPAFAKAYENNLKNLVAEVRSDSNAPDMKFVLGRITTMGKLWSTPEIIEIVRKAQENVPNYVKNSAWINTDDLQWGYYGHYGTKGQIDLGIRFADQFKPVASQSSHGKKAAD